MDDVAETAGIDSFSDDKSIDEFGAAKFLGLSVHTLRQWRSRGGGPVYVKLGGRVTYTYGRLREFRNQHEMLASHVPASSAA